MSQVEAANNLANQPEDEMVARAKAQSIAQHGDESGWKLQLLCEAAKHVERAAPKTGPAQPSTPRPAWLFELFPQYREIMKIERTVNERLGWPTSPFENEQSPARDNNAVPSQLPALRPPPLAVRAPVFYIPDAEPVPAGSPSPEPVPVRAGSSSPEPEPVPAGTASPAPSTQPESSNRLRTQKAHDKAASIRGEGATTHPDGVCTKCRRSGIAECIVNPNHSNGNTCARCAKNKEKCSHQERADGRYIRQHGRPARDGPCQHCREKAAMGQPAECYQADPTDKKQTKLGTACSQCMIDGTKESCSANEKPKTRNGNFRDS